MTYKYRIKDRLGRFVIEVGCFNEVFFFPSYVSDWYRCDVYGERIIRKDKACRQREIPSFGNLEEAKVKLKELKITVKYHY